MLIEHFNYVSDPIRLEKYKAAIRKVQNPGDRVADLGCGSGILGLLCLRAGADFVYAIDSSGIIEVARESFARNGLGEKVLFINHQSQQVVLPEQVDLLICDHIGYFGFDYGIVGLLGDARRRFLKSGGTLIPSGLKLQLAGVESEKCHELVESWRSENVPAEYHWLTNYWINTKHAVKLLGQELLCEPASLGYIDLYQDNPDFFSWDTDLHIARDGIMHGLGGWFECELGDGIWMTNSPLADQPVQRPQAIFPIGEPVSVKAGDCVKATIMARPSDNLIAWSVEFLVDGRRFNHSTWQGMALGPEEIIRANPNRVPQLSLRGKARMTILSYCDGRRTVREIEQEVLSNHPHLFPSSGEISRFVANVLGKDTE